jgi:hypothetical protein
MLRPYKSTLEGNMTLKYKKCRPMNCVGEGVGGEVKKGLRIGAYPPA